jgi:hypothetical protein
MAEDDLTNGEIRRTLERLERGQRDGDDRLADVAGQMVPSALFATTVKGLTDAIATVRTDMTEGFGRVEKTSLERRGVLDAEDKRLSKQITGINARLDAGETKHTAKAANWIAAGLLALTALGLLVTIIYGGR